MSIAIIGGGAAGMMAAASYLMAGGKERVVIIEKNKKLGVKVRISGGGRCNVTTGTQDIRKALQNYPRGGRYLRYAFHEFGPKDVYEFFETHGVPLKIEDDGRVFPKSNNGDHVVGVFERMFGNADLVEIQLGANVTNIKQKKDKFHIQVENTTIEVDKCVIATGGQSYRHTGSTGAGYALLQKVGHMISPLAPSLYACIAEEVLPCPGVSLQAATVRYGKHAHTGPILITHRGITGPAFFALSSDLAYEALPYTFMIDFLPKCTEEELLRLLTSEEKLMKNQKALLPKSLQEALLDKIQISEKRPQELSKKEKHHIVQHFKHFPVICKGKGAGDEFVTAGGIELGEVDQRTQESEKCKGLYVVGEVLNCDGYTGGYNLQNAWCTGYVAGKALAGTDNNQG